MFCKAYRHCKNADFELYNEKNMKRESDFIAELRVKYLNKSIFDVNENEIKKIAKSVSKEEIEQLIFNLHKKGISNRKIGKLLNISEGKVRYKLKGGKNA